MAVKTVIFDLDGVLRRPISSGQVARIEQKCGITPGSIERHARSDDLIDDLTLGRITREEWIGEIGHRLGSSQAVKLWSQLPLEANDDVLKLVRELRESGAGTAILTNGTDTVREEISRLGIEGAFDRIINSAEIGVRKPEPAAYRRALDDLSTRPSQALLVDDSPFNIEGARRVGMHGLLFVNPLQLKLELVHHGHNL